MQQRIMQNMKTNYHNEEFHNMKTRCHHEDLYDMKTANQESKDVESKDV